MNIHASNIKEYLSQLPEDRRVVLENLRTVILEHLPEGFKETLSYNMIGYVVPHSIYPKGYHTDPTLPLPFINLGSQKNYIAIYHMGIYADQQLHDWFVTEYAKRCKYKLDMGKSCIRLKRMDDIPYDLIGELVEKITVDEWVTSYDSIKSKRNAD
ncbi:MULTISPECIES: DUF1801 domain-containing protein [unclassified Fusibacter]|uniref:DUF1801 domain-containing protein n=1 Tax=unclassified Fusibacter TaxID=2624464 RepID=UPI001012B106|nr:MULTISPECIES: DUF1801 domain-containing protein [unclassified Fusibacter]MCK8059178.1 DUF1801 domain-containing protein [Fusibacter sp. A2]NPE22587.1 DUF1801 domain-containing protein [Fusibacter sp. A1]RXV60688.1 DUF1801 domain-containing protein [Fusibacter sp. A1]